MAQAGYQPGLLPSKHHKGSVKDQSPVCGPHERHSRLLERNRGYTDRRGDRLGDSGALAAVQEGSGLSVRFFDPTGPVQLVPDDFVTTFAAQ